MTSIQIHSEGFLLGRLVRLTSEQKHDQGLIADLLKWRLASSTNFISQASGVFEDTRTWLHGLLASDGGFWLIVLPDGRRVGHIGIKVTGSELELDNLLRGEKGGGSKLMSAACKALIRELPKMFDQSVLVNHTFEDNRAVVRMHLELGFKTVTKTPMEKTIGEGGLWRWVPSTQNPSRTLLTMKLKIFNRIFE